MKKTKTTLRNFEMAMGLIGSFIGIFSGSFLILLINVNHVHTALLGLLAIVGSLLGIFSSTYVRKNPELAGIGFIVATIFVILGSQHINVLSAVFLLIAGLSALFRN